MNVCKKPLEKKPLQKRLQKAAAKTVCKKWLKKASAKIRRVNIEFIASERDCRTNQFDNCCDHPQDK